MIEVNYRIVLFPKQHLYIAFAWNYDEATFITTKCLPTYGGVRKELARLSLENNCQLRWFDGDYQYDGKDCLVPITKKNSSLTEEVIPSDIG